MRCSLLKDGSPNGLFGDEMCQLTRYAGMSGRMSSLGIYGYQPEQDTDRQGAKLIAQMLWYFVDGFLVRKNEADPVADRADFIEYQVALTGNDTLFLKSKKTNRWWMQLPDASFTPALITTICRLQQTRYRNAGSGSRNGSFKGHEQKNLYGCILNISVIYFIT